MSDPLLEEPPDRRRLAAGLIRCMSTGAAPTASELVLLTARIWREGFAQRDGRAWPALGEDDPVLAKCRRAAAAALLGDAGIAGPSRSTG